MTFCLMETSMDRIFPIALYSCNNAKRIVFNEISLLYNQIKKEVCKHTCRYGLLAAPLNWYEIKHQTSFLSVNLEGQNLVDVLYE